jgi:hypothetical protein
VSTGAKGGFLFSPIVGLEEQREGFFSRPSVIVGACRFANRRERSGRDSVLNAAHLGFAMGEAARRKWYKRRF